MARSALGIAAGFGAGGRDGRPPEGFLADPAARAGEIQLCGLLAQLPGVLPTLLGLGFRTFSVDAGLTPWLGQRVRAIRIADAEVLAAAVCAACRSDQVTGLAGVTAAA